MNILNKIGYFSLLMLMLGLVACEPQQDGAIDLGLPPASASFTITPVSGEPNTYTLSNQTEGAFLFQWNLGNGSDATGETVEVTYQNAGTYDVTLRAFNKAGFAESVQSIVVDEDAPINCESIPELEFLTNCSSKTWTLANEEGALLVGPVDGSTVWWQSAADENEGRPCAWNDEWTFSSDDLSMVYDTKGDIWGEDYMGFNFECVATSMLGSAVAAWGDGTHSFEVIPGNPAQLKVVGEGAFLGIPKAANGAEVTLPVNAVTYDIISMVSDGNRDVLTVAVNYSAGIWTFKLESIN